MRVAVVGAGIGGLALAQGLTRSGIDVTVYERDRTLDSRGQGYRLHLHAEAALRTCLTPDLYDLCLATAGRPSTRITVLRTDLRIVHQSPTGPSATLSTSVNRGTLREILAARLDIAFGRTCTGFTLAGDRVRVHFADGTEAVADALVGADGVGSPLRRQYLPQLEVRPTGAVCVFGRTPLTEWTRPLVPAPVWDGFTAVVGGRVGMATGVLDFREPPPDAARRLAPDVGLTPVQPYLMWALTAHPGHFAGPLEGLDPAGLHAVAQATIRRWHRDVRALVEQATVEETTLVPIRSAVPVDPWPSSRVTLLGDAVHAMSPARGSGANTALRDAALLTTELAAAAGGGQDVQHAVAGYEREMVRYGFDAVRAADQAETSPRRSLLHRLAALRPGR